MRKGFILIFVNEMRDWVAGIMRTKRFEFWLSPFGLLGIGRPRSPKYPMEEQGGHRPGCGGAGDEKKTSYVKHWAETLTSAFIKWLAARLVSAIALIQATLGENIVNSAIIQSLIHLLGYAETFMCGPLLNLVEEVATQQQAIRHRATGILITGDAGLDGTNEASGYRGGPEQKGREFIKAKKATCDEPKNSTTMSSPIGRSVNRALEAIRSRWALFVEASIPLPSLLEDEEFEEDTNMPNFVQTGTHD
eukprot:GHVN01052067.1.p1 GENE.GHVN01052067.1~~GHVN01052067.1.p1  ORF type:complete len:249 (-),score=29.53 GHVN01052067.1:277-1023(-)